MAVHEQVDHAVDHSEVIVPFELLFQVDKIAVHSIEPPCEETAQVQADRWIRLKHGDGILHDTEATRFDGAHLGGVRHAEEGGEVAKDRARFIGAGHRDSAFRDLDDSLDEEIKQPGGGPFGDDRLPCVKAAQRFMLEQIEECAHADSGWMRGKHREDRAVSMPRRVGIPEVRE